ncbi:hypothetical protein CYMTET_22899 [Cymbomonas tetramitiformis]|uniref:Protein-serine/threonine kinase n=1 Tax=Cymbomonas tetramitiformis TaxID=36881 RepID=A0AAE0L1U2_9CHLO|nr:hypothetical protein CYMTET_22899 [Cymbomonas tetramitiformis]
MVHLSRNGTKWISGMIQRTAIKRTDYRPPPAGQLLVPGVCAPPLTHRTLYGGKEGTDTSFYDNSVEKYAQMNIRTVTLQEMMDFGRDNSKGDSAKLVSSANFLQHEMPIRLARRLMDLQLLPFVVVSNPHIHSVYRAYHTAFNALRKMKLVRSVEDNLEFTNVLKRMVDEHAPMVTALANGVRECRSKPMVGEKLEMDGFLDNMLRSRISRRVLAEQHISLNTRREGYVGVICTDLSVEQAVRYNVRRTKDVTMQTYGVVPDISIEGDLDTRVPYLPAHLDYMLFELLKNACRATVEHSMQSQHPGCTPQALQMADTRISLPKVRVRICDGSDNNVTVKISDQGGGIEPSMLDNIWRYGFTTVVDPASEENDVFGLSSALPDGPPGAMNLGAMIGGQGGGFSTTADLRNPMAGLGFGLPLSRLYAQYFGGDLHIVPISGMNLMIACRMVSHRAECDDNDLQRVGRLLESLTIGTYVISI